MILFYVFEIILFQHLSNIIKELDLFTIKEIKERDSPTPKEL